MDRAPLAWVLHDGKAGMASQALGLAEATGFAFEERRLDIRPPWAWLPPQLWARPLAAAPGAGLVPPWPDLVIGCGRNTAMPALAIRRLSRGRTVAVQVQDPRVGRDEFDLMVVPSHDRLRGERVIVTLGAVHRVTAARLAAERVRFPRLAALPHPVVAVLLGGGNRAYRQDPARLGAFARDIAAALRAAGGSLIATPSRRTGAAALAAFRAGLGDLSAWVWDGSGDNPYYALLAYADRFVVTADSVSMVSEAAATGKPVQILDLGGGDGKFARFHQAARHLVLRGAGRHRPRRRGGARTGAGAAAMKPAALAGLAAAALLLFLFPGIDLAFSRLFYSPDTGFIGAGLAARRLAEESVPLAVCALAALVAVAGLSLARSGRPLWRLDRKALAFIVVSTALGPGLVANVVLKDHWGRARPFQVAEFGGARQFTAAPLRADQCAHNCSFVSGHAALAFSLIGIAWLLPTPRARRLGAAAALGYGAAIGLLRIAAGHHFL